MSGYAKIWTDFLHDPWAQGLTLAEKGMWLYMILMAKQAGDSGIFSAPSWRSLGQSCGCDGKTARKILRKFRNDGKVEVTQNHNHTIVVTIHKYHYYQDVKRPGKNVDFAAKNPEIPHRDTPQTRQSSEQTETREEKIRQSPAQTKPDQTRAGQSGPVAVPNPRPWLAEPRRRLPVDVPGPGQPTKLGDVSLFTDDIVMNAFFNKFKVNLSEADYQTLFHGNAKFGGYKSNARLVFAITNIKVKDPGTVENPIGLLIDFHGNPGKYLTEFMVKVWNGLEKFNRKSPVENV